MCHYRSSKCFINLHFSRMYVASYILESQMTYYQNGGQNLVICKVEATRELLAVNLMTQLRLRAIKHCRDLQHRQDLSHEERVGRINIEGPTACQVCDSHFISSLDKNMMPCRTIRTYSLLTPLTVLCSSIDQRHVAVSSDY
jgi:hypothetical protein